MREVSKREHGKVEMSKPYELLLREMVASGKKIEDYNRHEAAREEVFMTRAASASPERPDVPNRTTGKL
jgi:hypothetical protein